MKSSYTSSFCTSGRVAFVPFSLVYLHLGIAMEAGKDLVLAREHACIVPVPSLVLLVCSLHSNNPTVYTVQVTFNCYVCNSLMPCPGPCLCCSFSDPGPAYDPSSSPAQRPHPQPLGGPDIDCRDAKGHERARGAQGSGGSPKDGEWRGRPGRGGRGSTSCCCKGGCCGSCCCYPC